MKASVTLMEVMETILEKNNPGISDIMNLISEASPKIFSYYVLFDEEYRKVLNNKILAHYINYQIGYESISLFLFALNRKMNEIMPYYNQLYENVLKLSELDLSDNMDYFEEFNQASEKTGQVVGSGEEKSKYDELSGSSKESENTAISTRKQDNTSTSQATTEANANSKSISSGNSLTDINNSDDSWLKGSNTPQGDIDGVRDTTYLSNLSHNTNDGTSHTEASDSKNDSVNSDSSVTENSSNSGNENIKDDSSQNTNENSTSSKNYINATNKSETKDEKWNDTTGYVKHIYGINNSGGALENLLRLRDAILNIDMMIIKELEVCFFALW